MPLEKQPTTAAWDAANTSLTVLSFIGEDRHTTRNSVTRTVPTQTTHLSCLTQAGLSWHPVPVLLRLLLLVPLPVVGVALLVGVMLV